MGSYRGLGARSHHLARQEHIKAFAHLAIRQNSQRVGPFVHRECALVLAIRKDVGHLQHGSGEHPNEPTYAEWLDFSGCSFLHR